MKVVLWIACSAIALLGMSGVVAYVDHTLFPEVLGLGDRARLIEVLGLTVAVLSLALIRAITGLYDIRQRIERLISRLPGSSSS